MAPRPTGGTLRRIRRNLWHSQRGLCHWCEKATVLPEILIAEYLPLDDLYKNGYADQITDLIRQLHQVTSFHVRWVNDIATIDHLLEQASGGTYDLTNLVMACSPCNLDRGVRYQRLQKIIVDDYGLDDVRATESILEIPA